MKHLSHHHQAGFTIVELMIATSVFALVLLMLTGTLVQVGRMYTTGLTSSRTQEAARNVIDQVTNDVRFGSSKIVTLTPLTTDGVTRKGYCVGNRRYSYVEKRPVSNGQPALVVDTVAACSSSTPPADIVTDLPPNSREVLPKRMQIGQEGLQITQSGNLVAIKVVIASGTDGDNLDLSSDPPKCDIGPGSEFCAVSTLSTAVTAR